MRTRKRMDYRQIIEKEVDWLFENFELQRMELSRPVDGEWDYVVKLKMGASFGHFVYNSSEPTITEEEE